MNSRQWDDTARSARRVALAAGARPDTADDYETMALDALSAAQDRTDAEQSSYQAARAQVYATLAQACMLDELRERLPARGEQ